MTSNEQRNLLEQLDSSLWRYFTNWCEGLKNQKTAEAIQTIPDSTQATLIREREFGKIELLSELRSDFSNHLRNSYADQLTKEQKHE